MTDRVDIYIGTHIAQRQGMDIQLFVVEKRHDIDCSHHFFGTQQGVVLRPLHRIDDLQALDPHPKSGKRGEEGQIDIAQLMRNGHKLFGYVAYDRTQFFRRHYHPHDQRSSNQHNRYHTYQSDTYNRYDAFHYFAVTTFWNLYLFDVCSFS